MISRSDVFFSSRRRHTRYWRDWSSDVCSSDLYTALNRLKDLALAKNGGTLASYAYQLGPAGNRTSVTELGGRQVNYTYDNLYRLKSETIAGSTNAASNGTISYLYDAVGNRQSRTST